MIDPTIYGKKTVAVAGAILLCGSIGLAQDHNHPGGAAGQTIRAVTRAMGSPDERHARVWAAHPLDKMFVSESHAGRHGGGRNSAN